MQHATLWNFNSSVQHFVLISSNTIDKASTVSGKSLLRREVITLRAKLSGAMYCYRSCLRVTGGRAGGRAGVVCLWLCGYVTTITRNCMHRSSPNWVCRWR